MRSLSNSIILFLMLTAVNSSAQEIQNNLRLIDIDRVGFKNASYSTGVYDKATKFNTITSYNSSIPKKTIISPNVTASSNTIILASTNDLSNINTELNTTIPLSKRILPNTTLSSVDNSSNTIIPSTTIALSNNVASSSMITTQPVAISVHDPFITIATSSTNGAYWPTGNSICRLINKKRKSLGLTCAAESTPGSIFNIQSLRNAESDFAIVQADWQEHAYNATGYFKNQSKFEKLRFVFSLYPEALTVIVKNTSRILNFDDLKGKVINVGVRGSGVRSTMEDIMKAKGWGKNSFSGLVAFTESEQIKSICNGSVDALIMLIAHPSELLNKITNTCSVRILNINDEIIKKFAIGNPEFSVMTIPEGLYNDIGPVDTISIKATLLTTSDTDDITVYNLTKSIFENLDAFKKLYPFLSDLDKQSMATYGQIAPYHDGALKYYKEMGLIK